MAEIQEILRQYWGYSSFRPAQEDAIRSVLAGQDTLVLLPTGGGKSVCFQVPALQQGKVCIVVTPLIALMKDQVDQLKRRKIPAAAIYSGMSAREIDVALDNCIHGNTAFLYVSPERLQTDLMIARTKLMQVGLLVVDEAHCVSQWGYDFRPAYLQIPAFRELLPGCPVMALTASATGTVQRDIIDKLGMKQAKVFRRTFARSNLSYSVFKTADKEQQLLRVLSNVPGTAIVYVRTRKRTHQVADWLLKRGIAAAGYHAGLTLKEREERQQAWIQNRIRVVVATNAFGMGIDKPDVRTVIHWDLPESLEAYYQEAGRAGRDGEKSFAVALYNEKDIEELEAGIRKKYPAFELLRRVYQSLANYFRIPVGSGLLSGGDFDINRFTEVYKLPVGETFYALKLLEQEGFIQLNEAVKQSSRLRFVVDKRELYDFQLRYPTYDKVVKLLLRLLGGEVFLNFMPVSEAALGKLLHTTAAEAGTLLQFLKERNIVEYEMKTDKPGILFLTPRYDAPKLPLEEAAIKKKEERDTVKIKAVVHYAEHPVQCRSILLLQYFDEPDGGYCGICDHCLRRNKRVTGETALRQEICNYLSAQGSVSPVQLQLVFRDREPAVFIATLEELVSEEVIAYNKGGNLEVIEKKRE